MVYCSCPTMLVRTMMCLFVNENIERDMTLSDWTSAKEIDAGIIDDFYR